MLNITARLSGCILFRHINSRILIGTVLDEKLRSTLLRALNPYAEVNSKIDYQSQTMHALTYSFIYILSVKINF